MITLVFHCRHRQKIDPDKSPTPVCRECGEKRIAHTEGVRPPTITGHARGPLVQTRNLGPLALNLAEKPLPELKSALPAPKAKEATQHG